MGIDLTSLVNSYVKQIILISLKLQPGTPVGYEAGIECFSTILVLLILKINSRTTNYLIHNDPFSTIDDESAALCHQRQFTNKYFLLLNFPSFFINKPAGYIHLRSKCGVAALRLLHIVTRPLEAIFIANKMQFKLAGVIGDRRKAVKFLDQALFQEPFEARPLYLHEIGKVSDGLGDLDRAAHAVDLQERKRRDGLEESLVSDPHRFLGKSQGRCRREQPSPRGGTAVTTNLSHRMDRKRADSAVAEAG